MLVLVIPQTYTWVPFVLNLRLIISNGRDVIISAVIGMFSNKLSFWRSLEVQYLKGTLVGTLVPHYSSRNWSWSWHGLVNAMPFKLGNALLLFINVIIQVCHVSSLFISGLFT